MKNRREPRSRSPDPAQKKNQPPSSGRRGQSSTVPVLNQPSGVKASFVSWGLFQYSRNTEGPLTSSSPSWPSKPGVTCNKPGGNASEFRQGNQPCGSPKNPPSPLAALEPSVVQGEGCWKGIGGTQHAGLVPRFATSRHPVRGTHPTGSPVAVSVARPSLPMAIRGWMRAGHGDCTLKKPPRPRQGHVPSPERCCPPGLCI